MNLQDRISKLKKYPEPKWTDCGDRMNDLMNYVYGERAAFLERLEVAREALQESKYAQRYCEDSWYSCPKAEDGCSNETEGTDCNCGADVWNAQIDLLLKALEVPR